ncbi:MAG: HNH endonuclease [Treponema sp.]|jgi:hypothetical protein|nr:HNH endonuclease [Treponema sp.]
MAKVSHIVHYTIDELNGIVKKEEVFRDYPKNSKHALLNSRAFWESEKGKSLKIEVGNCGTVKIDGQVIPPYEVEPGYWWIKIPGRNGEYPVYRFVAETWCECPAEDASGWQVHHIVNDGTINKPENLLWITEEDHRLIRHPGKGEE